MKNRTRPSSVTTQPGTTPRSTKRVVDAVVFSPPDLSFYLKLQNLLNYFIDCMNNLTSSTELYPESADHLKRCIQHISDLDISTTATFNDELQLTLNEFINDAHQFEHLVASFSNSPVTPRNDDQSAAVLLTAKASHLQWLSVCILEDLKKTHAPV